MMRHRIKISLVSVVVTVVAVLSIGATASANRLSVDDVDWRAVFPTFTVVTPGGTVECPVTMSGSFHRSTYAKVIDSLIGVVATARAESRCTGGAMTILQEALPFHVVYAGFVGTLPRIVEVNIDLIGFSASVSSSGAPGTICLWRTTTLDRLRLAYDYANNVWILLWIIRTPFATDDTGASTLCDALGLTVEPTEASGTRNTEDGAGSLIRVNLI